MFCHGVPDLSDWVDHSLLQTYPKFSHLQQQNKQIRRAMMITPPTTANVMINIWKFTAERRQRNTMTKLYRSSQSQVYLQDRKIYVPSPFLSSSSTYMNILQL